MVLGVCVCMVLGWGVHGLEGVGAWSRWDAWSWGCVCAWSWGGGCMVLRGWVHGSSGVHDPRGVCVHGPGAGGAWS